MLVRARRGAGRGAVGGAGVVTGENLRKLNHKSTKVYYRETASIVLLPHPQKQGNYSCKDLNGFILIS